MSNYSKFLDDLNDFYVDRKSKGVVEKISNEDALAAVRDKWIQQGKLTELISFIHTNWDSGNCDDFMKPLVDIFIKTNQPILFKRLWKGVLRYRTEQVWLNFSALKEHFPKMTVEDLAKVNLSNFNQFSSKEDIRRVAAFHRQYTLKGISEFISGLNLLNQTEEIQRANELYQTIYSLQKPSPKASTDKRKIDEEIFWQLIEHSRQNVEDQYEFLDKLKLALEAFKPNELRKFQRILLTKQQELNNWDHWALAYIVRRGCGDDEFDYFKIWAVSKGQNKFDIIKVLEISQLKDVIDEDPQLEDLLYLAETVYENKTTEIMKEVKVNRSKLTGKKWSEENITKDFPILCKLFNFAG